MVKLKLAAHTSNHETQEKHETRLRSRKRAKEIKRKAREAMELELQRAQKSGGRNESIPEQKTRARTSTC